MKRVLLVLESRYDARGPLAAILVVTIGRALLEMGVTGQDVRQVSMLMLAQASFYTAMFLAFSALVAVLLRRPYTAVANAVSVGLLFGLAPPLFDLALGGAGVQPYIYFRSFKWSLFAADQPLGESLVLWGLIVATGIFVLAVSHSFLKAVIAWLVSYGIVQLIALWAIWVQHMPLNGPRQHAAVAVGLTVAAALIYAGLQWKQLGPSLRRFVHALPMAALAAGGAFWVGASDTTALCRAGLVFFTFLVLIVHNDYYDRKEDLRAGRPARVTENDVLFTSFLLLLLAWGQLRIAPLLPWLVAAIALLGLLYHHPSFRLKSRFCLSYKIEGGFALFSFLCGAVTETGFAKETPLFWPLLLVFGGGSLLSMAKDYKDIESDRAENIQTLYVRLLRKGWPESRINRMVAAAITLGLLLPPGWLLASHGLIGWPVALLLCATLPGFSLLKSASRNVAVKRCLWSFALYLTLLALAIRDL